MDPDLLHLLQGLVGVRPENRFVGQRRDAGADPDTQVDHALKYVVVLHVFLGQLPGLSEHEVAEDEYHPVAAVAYVSDLLVGPLEALPGHRAAPRHLRQAAAEPFLHLRGGHGDHAYEVL